MQQNKFYQSAGGRSNKDLCLKVRSGGFASIQPKKKKEIKLSKQDTNQPLVFTRQIPLGWCWSVLIVACREPKSQAGWEIHYLCNNSGRATPSLARAAKLFWRVERGSAGHRAWQAALETGIPALLLGIYFLRPPYSLIRLFQGTESATRDRRENSLLIC